MIEYRINLAEVRSFDDVVAAFNAGLVNPTGGHWNGNLNALNDYLSWPQHDTYRLLLIGWDTCARILDQTPTPGYRSMLQVILEIFTDNPHVTVIHA